MQDERFRAELRGRLATFRLELHPDKTRLIACGAFALARRRERGLREAPETFNFLGFTHICARTRSGKFFLFRYTVRKRMTTKLHEVSAEMQRRRHDPIPNHGQWLASAVRGHYGYYGVPTNIDALDAFRTGVAKNR